MWRVLQCCCRARVAGDYGGVDGTVMDYVLLFRIVLIRKGWLSGTRAVEQC